MATRSLLVLAGLVLCSLFPARLTAGAPAQATLLVGLQPGMMPAEREIWLHSMGATLTGEIPQLGVVSITLPAGKAPTSLAALERDPRVRYAEPNARARTAAVPDDPLWARQWGPQKVDAPPAWDWTTGSPDLVIAIVDSGIDLDHPDLANQLWTNPGEVPSNGLDDDGNGQVDDAWGWHFYHRWNGQAYLPEEDGQIADDNGHGTHVAGIAGAQADNGVGVAGMAGGSRLMVVKVLDQYGWGFYFDIARGIVYAVDNGARIVNLSLGGKAASDLLQAAMDYARARGALVVAAAGNEGGAVLYPAACEHVLAVAATDPLDRRPAFSNYGPEVDLAAPGVDIISTWPWRDGTWSQSGTSMAAPHVAGLAALVWSLAPTWTPEEVGTAIARTAVDVQAAGWDPGSGWGRIDAHTAVRSVVQPVPVLRQDIDPGPHRPGDPVTYTITAGNLGQMVAGVVLSDTLPAQVQFLSATPPATYEPVRHELVWGPWTLARGEWVTATVVTKLKTQVAPCTRITNRVRLFYDGQDQPLVAEASYRALPCLAYLPVVPRAH